MTERWDVSKALSTNLKLLDMEKDKRARRRGFFNNPFLLISFLFLVFLLATVIIQAIYSSLELKGKKEFIPRIIHKSSLVESGSNNSPKLYKPSNSHWQYIWWTKKDTKKLVLRNFAWLLDLYDNMPSDGLRKDLAKFLFLYKYGGVYLESDTVSTELLDNILQKKCIMIIPENFSHRDLKAGDLLAGVPFHPFFLSCIRKIIEKYHRGIQATETKLLDSKALNELYEEWQSVKNQLYLENVEEPGVEPTNTTLVVWEIDRFPTSKTVPCYEVSLESKTSLFP